jgi:hypothetical protein
MDRDGATIEFTDRDLRLITDSLPKEVDELRLNLFPQILQEWGRTDLPKLLSLKPEPREVQTAQLELVTAARIHAAGLCQALDALDALGALDVRHLDLSAIILALACPLTMGLTQSDLNRAVKELQATREFLPRLRVAAQNAALLLAPQKGRPRNNTGLFILLDLAAILEWLTRSKPTRRVDQQHEEAGPLADLARAVWPVIFGNDDGLSSAIKKWAGAGARHGFGKKSQLICSLGLRNPAWRIFD